MAEPDASQERLQGEAAAAPGPVATVALLVTGVALVRAATEILGRVALGYRRPAFLSLTERGLEYSCTVTLLGRTLRDESVLVPLGNLGSVTREVRYPRLGLYAGLFALAIGTYLGGGLLVDGLRVPGGSPSLLGIGAGLIALGILLDFLLTSVWDAMKETCRIVVVPRRGPAFCLRGVDPARANELLTRVRAALLGEAPTDDTGAPAGGQAI